MLLAECGAGSFLLIGAAVGGGAGLHVNGVCVAAVVLSVESAVLYVTLDMVFAAREIRNGSVCASGHF